MSDAIREYDTVALIADLPAEGLVRGNVGAVVIEHSADVVEVEFSDRMGITYALLAVPKELLMKLHYHRVGRSP